MSKLELIHCIIKTTLASISVDENQFFPPNCETSSDVIETVLRNRQNILSINSSQWRDKIKKTLYPNPTYFFNYKVTFTVSITKSDEIFDIALLQLKLNIQTLYMFNNFCSIGFHITF